MYISPQRINKPDHEGEPSPVNYGTARCFELQLVRHKLKTCTSSANMETDTISMENTESPRATTEGLMSCKQAADYLNLSESYIRKAVVANRIPYIRFGTRVLFRRSDLDSYIAQHLVQSSSDVRVAAEKIVATTMLRSRRPNRRAR